MVPILNLAVVPFGSHRPSAGDGQARLQHGFEKSLPAGARCAFRRLGLGLLERIVDGDRGCRVGLNGEVVHRLRHAVEEELLGLLL